MGERWIFEASLQRHGCSDGVQKNVPEGWGSRRRRGKEEQRGEGVQKQLQDPPPRGTSAPLPSDCTSSHGELPGTMQPASFHHGDFMQKKAQGHPRKVWWLQEKTQHDSQALCTFSATASSKEPVTTQTGRILEAAMRLSPSVQPPQCKTKGQRRGRNEREIRDPSPRLQMAAWIQFWVPGAFVLGYRLRGCLPWVDMV